MKQPPMDDSFTIVGSCGATAKIRIGSVQIVAARYTKVW
jgi:hypothetical protein